MAYLFLAAVAAMPTWLFLEETIRSAENRSISRTLFYSVLTGLFGWLSFTLIEAGLFIL